MIIDVMYFIEFQKKYKILINNYISVHASFLSVYVLSIKIILNTLYI